MNFLKEYFFCSPKLLRNVDELQEICSCIENVDWNPSFSIEIEGKRYNHQTGYNKAFDQQFSILGWELQPRLHEEVGFLGDYRKNDVFVEVQFGNSASIFRDYYKFHYGISNGLLWLAVMIVPVSPPNFFPTRPKSVSNMAEFETAKRIFSLLKIPIPILLIGLLPDKLNALQSFSSGDF